MQASEIGTSAAGEGPPTFKKLAKSSAIEISLQVLTLGSYEVFPDNACLVVKPGSYYFSFSVPALLDMNFSFELSLEDVKSLEICWEEALPGIMFKLNSMSNEAFSEDMRYDIGWEPQNGGNELKIVCFFKTQGSDELLKLKNTLNEVQPDRWEQTLSAQELARDCHYVNFTVTTQAALPRPLEPLDLSRMNSIPVRQPAVPENLERFDEVESEGQGQGAGRSASV